MRQPDTPLRVPGCPECGSKAVLVNVRDFMIQRTQRDDNPLGNILVEE